jgi:PIN domain nuclease of toxin-antitoxin system
MIGYIQDACALIALLHNEEGATIVEDLLDKAKLSIFKVSIHKTNLLEVYYDPINLYGTEKPEETINELKNYQ